MQAEPPGDSRPRPPSPPAAAYLRAARGFSCLFWGLLIGVLLAAGTLRLEALSSRSLPAFAPGLALILWGTLLLRWTPPLSPAWPRRTNRLLFAGLACVYLSPFLAWWERAPHTPYLAVNASLLPLAVGWLILSIHSLAADAAGTFNTPLLRLEARLGQAVATLAMLFIAVALVYAAALRLGFVGNAHWVASPAAARWILLPLLLPVFLAMAVAWETKEWCLQKVRELA